MTVSYDVFTAAFLAKITEYNFLHMSDVNRTSLVDGYMKRACTTFQEVCLYDITNGNDDTRSFDLKRDDEDINAGDLEEIVDIVSDGMVYQWLKQHMFAQENLQNMLNTTDFSSYSPAELLYRLTNAYNYCERQFIGRIREYSYRHGDLTELHL